MKDGNYVVIGTGFNSTAEVPRDNDIFYRCTNCGSIIPSVPRGNIGCKCGNIFIDKDYWRLIVEDLGKLEAIKKKPD